MELLLLITMSYKSSLIVLKTFFEDLKHVNDWLIKSFLNHQYIIFLERMIEPYYIEVLIYFGTKNPKNWKNDFIPLNKTVGKKQFSINKDNWYLYKLEVI